VKRHLTESIILAAFFTALSYVVAIHLGWVTSVNWLEVFAVFTSYSCTWLCVRQRRINYPIGAVSTAAYAVLFLQADLYSSMILNVALTPWLLYGWYRWRADDVMRPVSHLRVVWVPAYVAVAAVAYYAVVWIVGAAGGQLVWTDSVVLVATVVAQSLMDNKKIECWSVWAIVNVFAIVTYTGAGLYLVAFQYVLFLVNTLVGYLAWRKDLAHEV
jgi:nicotinamide mononucleotide transporter